MTHLMSATVPAPRRARSMLGAALAAALALLVLPFGQGRASAAVVSPPAPPHSIIVFPQRDFLSMVGDPNTAVTVNLVRNGVVIGTASGTTDSAGVIEVNHPGGVCWTGFTPDILPQDVVQLLTAPGVGESVTTQNVTAVPAVDVGGTIVVHGTAQDAAGAPLPIASLESRLLDPARFLVNGRRDLRAPGDGTIAYDAPGSINWTATYTGLGVADRAAAAAAESRGMWLGATPALVNDLTIYEAGVTGGPTPGCPAAASFAVSTSAPAAVNVASTTTDLVISGSSQDASSVAVTLTDAAGKAEPAPAATRTPAAAAQPWPTTVPAAQVQTLADGRVTAAGTYTLTA